jgi:23S rRNA (adenine2030-N6)-methyltransferase
MLVETRLRSAGEETRLNGAGLVIVNPPWTLEGKLRHLLPFLSARLADGPGAGLRIERLGSEPG